MTTVGFSLRFPGKILAQGADGVLRGVAHFFAILARTLCVGNILQRNILVERRRVDGHALSCVVAVESNRVMRHTLTNTFFSSNGLKGRGTGTQPLQGYLDYKKTPPP